MSKPHILVDFDKTLAHYESWEKNGANLGSPIRPMVERVKNWLSKGIEVRVFTARANGKNPRLESDIKAIEAWCAEHLGRVLDITCRKDFDTLAIYDDIAVTVRANCGELEYEGEYGDDDYEDKDLR